MSLASTGLQYAKFCVVGGSGVVVDMAVLHFLVSPEWLGWNLTLSKVIGAEVAMFNNFLWNDGWTFREKASKATDSLLHETPDRAGCPQPATDAEGTGTTSPTLRRGGDTVPYHGPGSIGGVSAPSGTSGRESRLTTAATETDGSGARRQECQRYRKAGQRRASSWLIRLLRFNLICTVGIALSVVLLNLQVRGLGMNVYLANFISIVAVSFWNFILNRRYGWGASATTQGASEASVARC